MNNKWIVLETFKQIFIKIEKIMRIKKYFHKTLILIKLKVFDHLKI